MGIELKQDRADKAIGQFCPLPLHKKRYIMKKTLLQYDKLQDERSMISSDKNVVVYNSISTKYDEYIVEWKCTSVIQFN